MQYWESGLVVGMLLVVILLAGAELLRRLPHVHMVPACIIAGVLGLVLGDSRLGILHLDTDVLESIAYHGLGLMFIAMVLQAPGGGDEDEPDRGVRVFAVAIPFMEALQLVVGLSVVLVLGWAVGTHLHPGFGLMLPLGFEMGPGQALSLGAVWEAAEPGGMPDGAQVGLIVAAFGFGWSIVVGVPLVLFGKWKGWFDPTKVRPERRASAESVSSSTVGLDKLTLQVVAIAACYLVTYGICLGLSIALSGIEDLASLAWGFHFVIGAVVALVARNLLDQAVKRKILSSSPLDAGLLHRLELLSVDVMVTAALAAIQIGVLTANWVPILLVTTVGGAVTFAVCLALSWRLFKVAPFEHCVVWFGMSTGTLPMGIALLRMVDPDLRSPASLNAGLGSAAAIPLAAVVMIAFIPLIAHAWPEDYPGGALPWLGAAALFAVVLVPIAIRMGRGATSKSAGAAG